MSKLSDQPTSLRLPAWLEDELEEEFERAGMSTSEGMRRALEEWWALRAYDHIEFREGLTGRYAAVRGGPEVWEIVMVASFYGEDREGLREHFGWLEAEAVDEALDYYERFPDRVDDRIEENERVGEALADRLG